MYDSSNPDLKIHYIAGSCPVQAEGTIHGQPFYFRARGNRLQFQTGSSLIKPDWEYVENYGEGPFDAGWITQNEAMRFIEKAARLYEQLHFPQ